MAESLYNILGVEEKASGDEIRTAYRKLAKELHPDLNPGDKEAEERFKTVSAAFSILGDEEKRASYDRGEIDESGAEKAEANYYRHYADSDKEHQYHSTAGYEDFIDLGDLFADAFARSKKSSTQHRGQSFAFRGGDLRYKLNIEFLEAVRGAKKRISLSDGIMLDVTIPAGISDGQVLRFKDKGQPGVNGGPSGDAFVTVSINPHPYFNRQGSDIVIELPIAVNEAVLGASVEIPTIDGKVKMTLPKGSSTGQILRLRGKGIQGKDSKGDQLVRLKVVMPDKIDDELESFMKSWEEKFSYNPRLDLERTL